MTPKVSLVVLNWNKPDDTLECLASCVKTDYPNYEIILVDNASSDDSVARVKAAFPQVRVLVTPENLGYAGGNNVGMKDALERGADFVFLLNNDVVIEPDAVSELVRGAGAHPSAGILAPKVMYYDDRNVINSLGTSMDWLRMRPRLGDCNSPDDGRFDKPVKRDILLGAALFLRRSTLERIGLIDEAFFIFHEEADWCLRNLKAGSENVVIPSAVVYHKASKTMREFSALTHYYSSRNFLYLARKNARPARWALTRAGLAFHSAKNALRLAFAPQAERRMARIYFLGVFDYFAGNMGKCRREL